MYWYWYMLANMQNARLLYFCYEYLNFRFIFESSPFQSCSHYSVNLPQLQTFSNFTFEEDPESVSQKSSTGNFTRKNQLIFHTSFMGNVWISVITQDYSTLMLDVCVYVWTNHAKPGSDALNSARRSSSSFWSRRFSLNSSFRNNSNGWKLIWCRIWRTALHPWWWRAEIRQEDS